MSRNFCFYVAFQFIFSGVMAFNARAGIAAEDVSPNTFRAAVNCAGAWDTAPGPISPPFFEPDMKIGVGTISLQRYVGTDFDGNPLLITESSYPVTIYSDGWYAPAAYHTDWVELNFPNPADLVPQMIVCDLNFEAFSSCASHKATVTYRYDVLSPADLYQRPLTPLATVYLGVNFDQSCVDEYSAQIECSGKGGIWDSAGKTCRLPNTDPPEVSYDCALPSDLSVPALAQETAADYYSSSSSEPMDGSSYFSSESYYDPVYYEKSSAEEGSSSSQ